MARGPQPIGDILSELMARRGYGRVKSSAALTEAWVRAAGSLVAEYTRPAAVRRGTLEVIVANSTLIQELGFQKQALLKALNELLPDEGIANLRFRVGVIE